MRGLRYALAWMSLSLASAQSIVTMAGLPYSHRDAVDGKPALSAPLNFVYGIFFDKVTGRLLIHDVGTLFRLEPDGTLLAMVGMGRGMDGTVADGTLASGLYVGALRGMAQDATGALYLADAATGRVYRVGLDGMVTTFAGGGTKPPGIQSDGGLATDASLTSPRGLVFDSHGNLDIAEVYCHCIRQVSPAGIISTVFTLPQSEAFQYFEGLAIDSKDNLYAAEYQGNAVWKIAADGRAATIAGTGVPGFGGDGGPATAAQLCGPSGVTLGPDGSIYVADTFNQRVRRIAGDGTISTFAGTGVSGFSGDGGPAAAAQFFLPAQTLFDAAGNLYVSDYGNSRVRVVSPTGTISTVAGNGLPDPLPSRYTQVGDGGPALDAIFNMATSAAFGPSGELYVADNSDSRIRKIAPDGTVTTVAGTGVAGNSGDGGPAIQAGIVRPITVAVDKSGTVYFETGDSRVRKITPDGIIHLVAGTGTGTGLIRSGGDGGPAVDATLSGPKGLAIDAQGNVYIGDTSNARLRKVDTNGIITTIAGPGVLGADYWNAVAFDPQGNLYVAITHTGILDGLSYSAIDRVNPNGTLTPVAGNSRTCGNPPTSAFNYDGAPALQTPLCVIVGLTFDTQGAMYIPEAFYGAVLKVSLDGTIRRVVGSNTNSFLGDGGPSLLANLQGSGYYVPSSVALDANGDMFIPSGTRIREVIPGLVTARLSQDRLDFQGASPAAQSIRVTTNVAEPMPFAVQVKNGGAWLSTNRSTGQTGDLLTVSANPAGLAPGVYSATIQISIPGGAVGAALAVTLTMQ